MQYSTTTESTPIMIVTIHIGENGGAFGDEKSNEIAFSFTASFGSSEGVGEEEICTGENLFSTSHLLQQST